MFITDISIRRPVVSWVMSLILVLFGLFVFWKLPVRELPSGLQPPVVQVKVDYKSASAPIVNQEVTQVLEDVIGGAEGIKNIDSVSENGRSTINIEFDTEMNLDNAANDIRERVARVADNLPTEAEPPQILKQAAGFTTTMWIALSSSTWSDLELGDYAERYLVDRFSSIKNVGRILVGGLRELSVRIWIDPIKLAANDLTIQELENALRNENVSLPAGTLEVGESPLESIKREVQEESGYSAKRWDNLGEMLPCPGYSDEIIHIFLARDLTKLKKKPEGDADEDIEVLKIAPEKLNKLIASGKESLDGKTITAWFRACQILNIK